MNKVKNLGLNFELRLSIKNESIGEQTKCAEVHINVMKDYRLHRIHELSLSLTVK